MKNLKKLSRESLKKIAAGNAPPMACSSNNDCGNGCCGKNGKCSKGYDIPGGPFCP